MARACNGVHGVRLARPLTEVAEAKVDRNGASRGMRLGRRGRCESDGGADPSAHAAQAARIECPEQAEHGPFAHLDEDEREVDAVIEAVDGAILGEHAGGAPYGGAHGPRQAGGAKGQGEEDTHERRGVCSGWDQHSSDGAAEDPCAAHGEQRAGRGGQPGRVGGGEGATRR